MDRVQYWNGVHSQRAREAARHAVIVRPKGRGSPEQRSFCSLWPRWPGLASPPLELARALQKVELLRRVAGLARGGSRAASGRLGPPALGRRSSGCRGGGRRGRGGEEGRGGGGGRLGRGGGGGNGLGAERGPRGRGRPSGSRGLGGRSAAGSGGLAGCSLGLALRGTAGGGAALLRRMTAVHGWPTHETAGEPR